MPVPRSVIVLPEIVAAFPGEPTRPLLVVLTLMTPTRASALPLAMFCEMIVEDVEVEHRVALDRHLQVVDSAGGVEGGTDEICIHELVFETVVFNVAV